MLPTAHILAPMVGLLLYGRWQGRTIPDQQLLLIGVLGALPDMLNIHHSATGRAGWSHSMVTLGVLAIAVALTDERLQEYLGLLLGGFSVHILLDIISAPYNFLYPLDFSYSVDIYPEFGAWFVSWYAVDILFLAAFVLLIVYRDPS